jgi:hypothetical protein
MTQTVLVRPRGTSWTSVVGGWIASVGTMALAAPVAAAAIATRPADPDNISLAVPVIVGLMLAYIVGGFVAGRMAGYATSWHGMLVAFFGLFIVLSILLLGVAADRGVVPGLAVIPGVGRAETIGDAFTFGGIIGFLATIFSGWLGGLLAPDRYIVPLTTRPATVEPLVARSAPTGYRLLPSAGRKGGERVTDDDVASRT